MEKANLLPFAKLHGLGNDFIATHHAAEADLPALKAHAPHLCDRRRGIGADGILAALPSQRGDFRMVTINADGSEAEMCGNGVRCFALYLNEAGLSDKTELTIETPAGLIKTQRAGARFRVDMRPPVLDAPRIPTAQAEGRVVMAPLEVDGRAFAVTAVSMGPPHAVIYADELSDDLVLGWGPKLERHPFFPNGVNVNFIRVCGGDAVQMRVWERGCGETPACGTGACASVVAGVLVGRHGHEVTVHLRGGDLLVEWDGTPSHPVYMTGPAAWVFAGEVEIKR